MTTVYRRSHGADAAALSALLRAFNAEFDASVPDEAALTRRWRTLLEREDVLVVLAEHPAPVGFAYLTLRPTPYYDGPLAQLEELYVVPELRGQGIGTGMITTVVDELRARGCGEIHINVDEPDTGARRFYERHGFSNVETEGAGRKYRMLCYIREL
ncbi:GNAT family N-acetyltransferase [Corynebacterium sp. CCUG 71335]|uniref:GNAT family N-acetyltransferase n=1 Tax=Corynebacterium sp. CCUG 71335 TaxID=2823892 RepID=UPI00210C5520|nr:GNAT family N-acetyltransferase [Corynebacterium sp. CCUG 71335]MCQ4619706.1 GNAT family N-acetyltransferase [Corynebacterium sp. CCUG 71335]